MTEPQVSKKGDFFVYTGDGAMRNFRDNGKGASEYARDNGGFVSWVPLGADITGYSPFGPCGT